MDLQRLNQYLKIKKDIRPLEEQINQLYLSLPSPGAKENGGGGKPSGISDPTARNAMEIIRRKEILEKMLEDSRDEMEAIEDWINSVDDPEYRAIARYRYILGYTWRKTNDKVYDGRASESLAQVKFMRWLKLYG